MTALSDRLKELRIEHKLLQKDIAKKLNITTSAYGFYEQDKRVPDSNTLNSIAKIFEVSLDYLMGVSNIRTPQQMQVAPLTKKDNKDIAKDLDAIMDKIDNDIDSPLYYNGSEIDNKDRELLKNAMEIALKLIKVENKEKYTPKKYRN